MTASGSPGLLLKRVLEAHAFGCDAIAVAPEVRRAEHETLERAGRHRLELRDKR
jgi:hypothetical protein